MQQIICFTVYIYFRPLSMPLCHSPLHVSLAFLIPWKERILSDFSARQFPLTFVVIEGCQLGYSKGSKTAQKQHRNSIKTAWKQHKTAIYMWTRAFIMEHKSLLWLYMHLTLIITSSHYPDFISSSWTSPCAINRLRSLNRLDILILNISNNCKVQSVSFHSYNKP